MTIKFTFKAAGIAPTPASEGVEVQTAAEIISVGDEMAIIPAQGEKASLNDVLASTSSHSQIDKDKEDPQESMMTPCLPLRVGNLEKWQDFAHPEGLTTSVSEEIEEEEEDISFISHQSPVLYPIMPPPSEPIFPPPFAPEPELENPKLPPLAVANLFEEFISPSSSSSYEFRPHLPEMASSAVIPEVSMESTGENEFSRLDLSGTAPPSSPSFPIVTEHHVPVNSPLSAISTRGPLSPILSVLEEDGVVAPPVTTVDSPVQPASPRATSSSPPPPPLHHKSSPPSSITSSVTAASDSTALTHPPLEAASPACSSSLSSLSSSDDDEEQITKTTTKSLTSPSQHHHRRHHLHHSMIPIPKLPPALIRSTAHEYRPMNVPESFLRTKVDSSGYHEQESVYSDEYSYNATDEQMAESKLKEEEDKKLELEREKTKKLLKKSGGARLDKGKGKEVVRHSDRNVSVLHNNNNQLRWIPTPPPPAKRFAPPGPAPSSSFRKPLMIATANHLKAGEAMNREWSTTSTAPPLSVPTRRPNLSKPASLSHKAKFQRLDPDGELATQSSSVSDETERLREIEREKRRARDRRALEARLTERVPQEYRMKNSGTTVFQEILDISTIVPTSSTSLPVTPLVPNISIYSARQHLLGHPACRNLLSLPTSFFAQRHHQPQNQHNAGGGGAGKIHLSSLSPLSSPEPDLGYSAPSVDLDSVARGTGSTLMDAVVAKKSHKRKPKDSAIEEEDFEWTSNSAAKAKAAARRAKKKLRLA